MPYKITWNNENPTVKYTGMVTLGDINETMTRLIGDARYDDIKYQLLDFTETEHLGLSEKDMNVISSLGKSASHWNNKMKMAIVTSDPDIIAKTKYYIEKMKAVSWNIQIFDSFSEAEDWFSE